MDCLFEETIRPLLGAADIQLLDLWGELSTPIYGRPIEAVTVNRRHVPEFAKYPGELNTAWPVSHPDRGIILIIAMEYEPDGSFEEIVWTHEVGHWVLNLQGYTALRDLSGRPNSNIQVCLNSLCAHRPLYRLQRSFGMEPQDMIDERAQHDLDLVATTTDFANRDKRIEVALVLADDILSCEPGIAKQLRAVVEESHPRISQRLDTVLGVFSHYDLNDRAQINKASRRIVQALKLGNRWVEFDNRAELAKLCKSQLKS